MLQHPYVEVWAVASGGTIKRKHWQLRSKGGIDVDMVGVGIALGDDANHWVTSGWYIAAPWGVDPKCACGFCCWRNVRFEVQDTPWVVVQSVPAQTATKASSRGWMPGPIWTTASSCRVASTSPGHTACGNAGFEGGRVVFKPGRPVLAACR